MLTIFEEKNNNFRENQLSSKQKPFFKNYKKPAEPFSQFGL